MVLKWAGSSRSFGILSSYLNHLYWLTAFPASKESRPHYRNTAPAWLCLFFLLADLPAFPTLPANKTDFEEHISTVAAVLNMGLLLGCMKFPVRSAGAGLHGPFSCRCR